MIAYALAAIAGFYFGVLCMALLAAAKGRDPR